MTVFWAILFIVGFTALAVVAFRFLAKKEAKATAYPTGVKDLLDRRKNTGRYRLPVYLFSLVLSLVFVSWSFETKYAKLVEKKLYSADKEELDTIIPMVISSPPPPPKSNTKPVETVVKVEVPEFKITKEELDEDPIQVNETDDVFDPNNLGGNDPGPPGGNGKGQAIEETPPAFADDCDNYQELQAASRDKIFYSHMSNTLGKISIPRNAPAGYTVNAAVTIDKEGNVESVDILKNAVELRDSDKKVIIDAIKSYKMPFCKINDVPTRVVTQLPLKLKK